MSDIRHDTFVDGSAEPPEDYYAKPKLNVAIVGSRGVDTITAHALIDLLLADNDDGHGGYYHDICIISGGAPGVDQAAIQYAERLGLRTVVFPAEWDKHGKRAGYLRNIQIVEAADQVKAVWDGVSPGTKLTIDLALKHRKHLEVVFA